MVRRVVLLLTALLLSLSSRAQTTIRGTVSDGTNGQPIGGVSVSLLRHGRALSFVRSSADGSFSLRADAIESSDSLLATCLGYSRRVVGVRPQVSISLTPEEFWLSEVRVRGGRVLGRADTTVYDLTRFATNRDNTLGDVLRKLPGVEVGDNGEIRVNGKALSRFTVEGLDMTGGRYNLLQNNIKAGDVKSAEVIDHDQPVKALQGKVMTDNVAMNIVMKDSVGDKLSATLRPYLLVGEPTGVGGAANLLQVGKRRQLMYDLAYNRTGKDLSQQANKLATRSHGLSAATVPQWISGVAVASPIDAERLRLNTTQSYTVDRASKPSSDSELRLSAHYLRSVERLHTANETIYRPSGGEATTTRRDQSLTARTDDLSLEMERTVNTPTAYGNSQLNLSARRADGRYTIGDTLSQHTSLPEVNVAASLNPLYTIGRGQISVASVVDWHHGKNSLSVADWRRDITTNLWHAAASVGWLRQTSFTTRRLTAMASVQNTNAMGNNSEVALRLSPRWQYKRGGWLASASGAAEWRRYPHQRQSLPLWGGGLYARWDGGRHSEWHMAANYGEDTGWIGEFGIDSVRQDYRTWYTSDGRVPKNRSLSSSLTFIYKRPVVEFFMNGDISGGRAWSDHTTDVSVANGVYRLSLVPVRSRSDFLRAEGAVSKGFFSLHLKTRLGASLHLNHGQQMWNGSLTDYRTQTCRLEPNVEFAPQWCALSYRSTFQWQRSNGQRILFGWKQSLQLTSTVGHFDLSVGLTHYHNELQSDSPANILFGDARAVWRMGRLRLQLALSNLANRKEYVVSQISGISTQTDRFRLRGRELLVSAQIVL